MPETILQIIKLSLELAIKVHDDIPPPQRTQFWLDVEKNLAFWRALMAPSLPPTKG